MWFVFRLLLFLILDSAQIIRNILVRIYGVKCRRYVVQKQGNLTGRWWYLEQITNGKLLGWTRWWGRGLKQLFRWARRHSAEYPWIRINGFQSTQPWIAAWPKQINDTECWAAKFQKRVAQQPHWQSGCRSNQDSWNFWHHRLHRRTSCEHGWSFRL